MYPDTKWRDVLNQSNVVISDRVDCPWDSGIPDVQEFNRKAFVEVINLFIGLRDDPEHKTRGILLLGEAGSGKTHLLMRIQQKMAQPHSRAKDPNTQILFIRKPNNEYAIAQHIWENIIASLCRPYGDTIQLDNLLANVFAKILIPRLEQIKTKTNAIWVEKLKRDPSELFSLFSKFRAGRQYSAIRKIIQYVMNELNNRHPDVQPDIASALLKYCSCNDNDKHYFKEWLRGNDLEAERAEKLGLSQNAWLPDGQNSTEAREEFALKAICTLGILSTYYSPLVLAFDQLEGLNQCETLTRRFGDTLREIFTHAHNYVIVTCVFPILWRDWFSKIFEQSACERIAQQRCVLSSFSETWARSFLEKYMEKLWKSIPHDEMVEVEEDSIFPFTDDDLPRLCLNAQSPRAFLQRIRGVLIDGQSVDFDEKPVEQKEIQDYLEGEFQHLLRECRDHGVATESDFLGRIVRLFEVIVFEDKDKGKWGKAKYGAKVMPDNRILPFGNRKICISVLNQQSSTGFPSRMRNLLAAWKEENAFTDAVVLRDDRCRAGIGPQSRKLIDDFNDYHGQFRWLAPEYIAVINAMYRLIIAYEQHDLECRGHEIELDDIVRFFRRRSSCPEVDAAAVAITDIRLGSVRQIESFFLTPPDGQA